jgi:hypothetical protein
MRHSRFKYFSRLEYAEQFMAGRMFCQTAAFFRDYEDSEAQQVIGDEYEGTHIFRPAKGLEIHNHTRGTNGILHMGMECLTKAHEIYVFCVSFAFNELLKQEFKAVTCVEIKKPVDFISRWLKALPYEAKPDGQHIARRVGYYRPEDLPGNVWALPDLITTTKLKQFEYQQEYRFAYTKTDAFGFENCKYQLVDRKARPLPRPEEHLNETLCLGDLDGICKLHEFKP